MDAQLVLQTDHPQVVPVAQPAIRIWNELRHHEKADPLRPLGRVWQPGEDQMADIRGQVAVAPGDEDLLPGHRIGPVAVRHRLRPQRAHVGPGLRLGQVHRARPLARGQPGQIERLQLVRSMMLKSLDLALRQQRLEMERQAGPRHHVVHPQRQRDRKPHAAERRVGGHPDPAALGNRAIALGKAGRGDDGAILQPGRVAVCPFVQRCQDVGRDPARLGQDRLGKVRRRFGKSGRGSDLGKPHDVIQNEPDILDRGAIGHGASFGTLLGKSGGLP